MKYFTIVGETGTGYTEIGNWNHRTSEWQFRSQDSTDTTFDSRDAAEAELIYAQDDDIRNIHIESYEIDDED